MIKIALCDDESKQLSQTEALLQEYHLLHPEIELSVKGFSSGQALLEYMMVKGAFDIYLLDVVMPDQNGIEVGLGIRKSDQNGRIICLTGSPDFTVDSCRIRTSAYLLKPPVKERLFQTLDYITKSILQENLTLVTINTRDGFRRLPPRSIVYCSLTRRCVQYNLSDGSVIKSSRLRSPFQNTVAPLLEIPCFILCTESSVVNLSFVEQIDASGLRLTDGTILPISNTLRTAITGRWLDFCLEES